MYRSDYEEDSSTESIDYLGPETRGANLKLFCRDYNFLSFDFNDISECRAAFESIMRLTCIDRIDKCYAFLYEPIGIESPFNSWNDYDVIREFEREGLHFKGNDSDSLGSFGWRITKLNADYNLCESYPSQICIPRTFSDTMLGHTVRSRSKRRFPALAYYYKKNGCTIVRSSQPLVGLKQNRSFQDEKLLYEVFRTNGREDKRNLIVDARPMTSALAQVALGGGTENMDNYWGDRNRKLFLGLENIHVMRESIGKIKDLLKNGDVEEGGDLEWPEKLSRSGWTGHISGLLRSTDLLVKWIHLQGVHIVIHCSDGWDRTPQVISLVQICIDPYFRTLEGFIVLVEKDWCSFGHRFNERCGHLQKEAKFYNYTSDSNFRKIRELNQAFKHQQSTKFESPVFQQFLDCVYQLIRQYPTSFEYNERFLRRLVYHLYSCQYGTFLEDCEKERVELRLSERTRSVWDYFKARRGQFTNEYYEGGRGSEAEDGDGAEDEDEDVLYPNFTDVIYWYQLYGKKYEEMNELKQPVVPEEPKEPPNEAKLATEVVLERKLERLEIE
ncbi:DEKNAAC104395 [Brettanomyces naardenensis]|uniref:DEKNAAC104395 n=1 Tax=Brettanomyces naardenensis TaxID=13370 RepID=A0A448YQS7_BRENA|nr:DEKNAAC104395 [Brettanomyces naardenensis]